LQIINFVSARCLGQQKTAGTAATAQHNLILMHDVAESGKMELKFKFQLLGCSTAQLPAQKKELRVENGKI